MKTTYKGHEIEVYRDDNMVADGVLFYSIFQKQENGRHKEIDSAPYYGTETVREFMRYMKKRVDSRIEEGLV